MSDIEQKIRAKIEKIGKPLKDWDIKIYRGILTGCNEAFIINKEKRDELIRKSPNTAEIIRPILRGRDIKRYGYEFADKYLIATFPSRKYNIDDYPAIREYLLEYGKSKLEQSGKTGARKKTSHKWFETQDPIAYWDDFSKQKIVWARLMRISKTGFENFPRFAMADKNMYVVDSLCFITGTDLKYLQCVLNSELAKYYFLNNIAILDNGGMQMRQQYVELLPIPDISVDLKKIIIEKTAEFQKTQSDELDNEINEVIYNTYDFTTQEKSAIKSFIMDKEGEISKIIR